MPNTLRWVILSPVFPPFRAAEADYCATFAEQLSARGYSVTVITSPRLRSEKEPSAYRVLPLMKKWNWLSAWRLYRTIVSLRPDRVVILYLGWIYFQQTMITWMPTFLRVRGIACSTIFYNCYGVSHSETGVFNRLFHRVLKWWAKDKSLPLEFGGMLRDSDRLLAFSEQHARALGKFDARAKPKLEIFPALPLIPIEKDHKAARLAGRRRMGIDDGEKAIVFFGYLYHNKGLSTLVQALGRLHRSDLPAHLFLVGGKIDSRAAGTKSYGDELISLAESCGVKAHVHFTGDFEFGSSAPSELLFAADCFCMPFDIGISLNNSSVATVLWHNAPLVSTSRADLEAVFRHQENVLLSPPKDPEQLAVCLQRALTDAALAETLVRGGQELAASSFSWSRALDSLHADKITDPARSTRASEPVAVVR